MRVDIKQLQGMSWADLKALDEFCKSQLMTTTETHLIRTAIRNIQNDRANRLIIRE